MFSSESVSIPKNPRTDRPVGYAFVDLSTPSEAERAIAELSGKEILERKVSVQLARKPETSTEKADANGEGGEGSRRRPSGRGRGRARGRGGRAARGGRAGAVRIRDPALRFRGRRPANPDDQDGKEEESGNAEGAAAPAAAAAVATTTTNNTTATTTGAAETKPLADITNQAAEKPAEKARPQRERRERGPPADGIPSKTKVMVANLPYDLTEDKVSSSARSFRGTFLPLTRLGILAQGTVCCLPAIVSQDRASTHPAIHDQEAAGSGRGSQGSRLRLRHPCL